ncbi:MAG: hypothetical protein IJO53_01470, partial [Clostridia bacterium]|nr:hypothetical protein [Clostridia bacterium]
ETTFNPDWVNEAESVMTFNAMLVKLGWLNGEGADPLSLNTDVYRAIDAFQLWYNSVVAEDESMLLPYIRNEDGTFTDINGLMNTIDEATYNAIMLGIHFNPDF